MSETRDAVEEGQAPLLIEQRHDVARLVLNRPRRANALSPELVEQMLDALADAEAGGVRLVTIEGGGRHFCSGFDLAGFESQSDGDLLRRFVRIELLLQRVHHAPFVTVALAQGRAVGAGADLFCACSLRVAAPEAEFRMPGWQFGLALGTRRLVHRVGPDMGRALLQDARRFDASFAVSSGFATRVAAPGDWPALIEEARRAASVLDPKAFAALGEVTMPPDTRSEDMASLVATAALPGLQSRMVRFFQSQAAKSAGA